MNYSRAVFGTGGGQGNLDPRELYTANQFAVRVGYHGSRGPRRLAGVGAVHVTTQLAAGVVLGGILGAAAAHFGTRQRKSAMPAAIGALIGATVGGLIGQRMVSTAVAAPAPVPSAAVSQAFDNQLAVAPQAVYG